MTIVAWICALFGGVLALAMSAGSGRGEEAVQRTIRTYVASPPRGPRDAKLGQVVALTPNWRAHVWCS